MSTALKTTSPTPTRRGPGLVPGLALSLVIAAVATVLGLLAPIVGAPVCGILLGVVLAQLVPAGVRKRSGPGVGFASKRVLQVSVVLLGTQLSLGQVVDIGVSSLPVMIGTLVVCLGVAYLVGRWMGVDGELTTLIGTGTAICGASAIAAVSSVTRPRPASISYAISTIFVFNIAAVLLFPPLGHLLGMGQQEFGLFAGTAVNDTSSVVAAATTYGHEAGDHAVVVKLVRTLMIIPICIALSALVARRTRGVERSGVGLASVGRLVPWFLVGFLVCAAAQSAGLIPGSWHSPLQHVSLFLITTALAAIGFSTDVAGLRSTGARPLLLGAVLWVTVTVTSLVIQALV